MAQMILLRELLIVFSGNEFSIGIILANWLVMEALGSLFVGRQAERVKRVLPSCAGLTALFSLSLPVMVYLTRILRSLLGLSIGQEVGIVPIVFASCLILLPVSAPHGALFAFGFAGMVLSLVLVYLFQAAHRYVFAWIGLLVAAFMTGSASGGMIVNSLLPRLRRHLAAFCAADLLIIGFTGLLAFLILVLQPWLEGPASGLRLGVVVPGLSLASGMLISAQFPLAGQLRLRREDGLGRTAGSLYACDLMGGWAGGTTGGALLLPVMGIVGTCLAAAAVSAQELAEMMLGLSGDASSGGSGETGGRHGPVPARVQGI